MASPSSEEDFAWMQRALECARKGLGRTAPNPPVGAIVVRSSRAVGDGYHAKAGGPHAEVAALAKAGRRAAGATIYVTLEPCHHHGRTPPCTAAIVAARPARVVIGCRDPNPRVAGRGIRALRAAGIAVDLGVDEPACRDLIRGFDRWVREGRPWVHLKLASTLDGRIATRSGQSQWISSPASRRRVQEMRARADAIAVGIGTVLADDPRLTCRIASARQPLRVVLDHKLRTPPTARVVVERRGGCLIVCAKRAPAVRRQRLERAGAEILEVPGGGVAAWHALLAALGARGVHELLVEGGARVAASALKARVVQGATFFYNPRLIGGDGLPMIASLDVDSPGAALAATTRSWSTCGPDLVWDGVFA
jgi:diaminohydroxyphosphoribosylaminopyrimidine deaminase/5-amino-6-(5-phosphoribosylamino)uracil reductase